MFNTIYFKFVFMIAILTAASISICQPITDRLLPNAKINNIEVEWKQDGRVVDIILINKNDELVISSIDFIVAYDENNVDIINNTKNKPLTLDNFLNYTVEKSDNYLVSIRLLPNQKKTTYIELEGEIHLKKLKIKEMRGHVITYMDKLKSVIE